MTSDSGPTPSTPARIQGDLRAWLLGKRGALRRRRWVDYAFIVAFVLLLVITATVSDVFFTQRNLSNLGRQAVTNGLLSLGMLVVILTGGIDLSVGSVVALAAVMVSGMSKGGMPLLAGHPDLPGRRGGGGCREWLLHRSLQAAAIHRDPGDDGSHSRAGLRVFGYSDHSNGSGLSREFSEPALSARFLCRL